MHLFRIFIVFNGINASQPESDSVNSELNRWLGSDDDGVRYMGPREYWESHRKQCCGLSTPAIDFLSAPGR